MPDIDIDFAPNGRQKIIDYVVEKYGEGQVGTDNYIRYDESKTCDS